MLRIPSTATGTVVSRCGLYCSLNTIVPRPVRYPVPVSPDVALPRFDSVVPSRFALFEYRYSVWYTIPFHRAHPSRPISVQRVRMAATHNLVRRPREGQAVTQAVMITHSVADGQVRDVKQF